MEVCPQDKRVSLEIRFDDDGKVSLARCCFLYAFSHLTLEEYGKIEDIIDYAENSKINYAKSSNICVAKCYLEKKIKQVDVGISHACNMHCMNCFFKEHKDTPEMKKAYFDTLYKIKGHQLDTIMMNNGGEVFVYYDEIIEYLKSLTPNDTRQVTFVTNLVLLNEERFKELKQISENTGVIYFFLPSVDGIKKESYEAIRLGGKFEKITENLHLLADVFGPQQAVILYTIKKPNINETENVEKYFMDTFGIRCSISFDVYDKECEEKYNSIFINKNPKEKDIKRLVNTHFNIYILTKKCPKWIKRYMNVFFIKTPKKQVYFNMNLKIFTPYILMVDDLSKLNIECPSILEYFLSKTNRDFIKLNNVVKQDKSFITKSGSFFSYNLIIKTDFFRKNFYNLNLRKSLIKNFKTKDEIEVEIPEKVAFLSDKKLYKEFY